MTLSINGNTYEAGELIAYVKKLEKENAELNNFIMQSKKDGISPINALIIKNLGNQLTKAKELLKRCYDNYIYEMPIRGEIEQFLSEVEK